MIPQPEPLVKKVTDLHAEYPKPSEHLSTTLSVMKSVSGASLEEATKTIEVVWEIRERGKERDKQP